MPRTGPSGSGFLVFLFQQKKFRSKVQLSGRYKTLARTNHGLRFPTPVVPTGWRKSQTMVGPNQALVTSLNLDGTTEFAFRGDSPTIGGVMGEEGPSNFRHFEQGKLFLSHKKTNGNQQISSASRSQWPEKPRGTPCVKMKIDLADFP